jgi:adrenodoxin-NADP+ reductase
LITVSWNGWNKINQVEVERGMKIGKPREKIVDIDEMLQIGGEL